MVAVKKRNILIKSHHKLQPVYFHSVTNMHFISLGLFNLASFHPRQHTATAVFLQYTHQK